MERIGIIGIGLVGTALAERLIHAGFAITGFDVNPQNGQKLEAMGGETVSSAVAVAAACRRVFLCLPTSDIAASVLEDIAGNLPEQAMVIDTTTGSPEDSERFWQQLRDKGIEYVDATIGGSSRQLREGDAIFICGGTEEAFHRCQDLFVHVCRRAFAVGPAGSGARMKLVTNLVLGLNRAALAEGLTYARAMGLDASLALEILRSGPAYSLAMDIKGRKMLEEDFEPEARLSQHFKDVRLILSSGAQCGAPLPLSAIHAQLLQKAEDLGYGAKDNSAVIKAFSPETD